MNLKTFTLTRRALNRRPAAGQQRLRRPDAAAPRRCRFKRHGHHLESM